MVVVDVEKEKDREGREENVGQSVVGRGRERELGEVGGEGVGEGGGGVGEGENTCSIKTLGMIMLRWLSKKYKQR